LLLVYLSRVYFKNSGGVQTEAFIVSVGIILFVCLSFAYSIRRQRIRIYNQQFNNRKMMSRVVAVVALLLVVSVNALKDSTLLYIFAYTWTPEFCYGNEKTYPGCSNTTNPSYSFWGSQMTTHGLWPQYIAGGYPADCTTEAFNSSVVTAVGYDNFVQYWPNVQYAQSDPLYTSFWDHEWTKHGTCSGLAQADYFTHALNVVKTYGTPSIISSNVGKTISSASVREAFGGATYASLQCTAGKYFNGAFMCLSYENGVPTGKTVCPADVQAEDTCGTGDIIIQAFTV